MNLSDFLSRFDEVRDGGDGNFLVKCGHHQDSHPSLLVAQSPEDGRLLLKCRAGCDTKDVLAAMDLHLRDLFNAEKRPDSRRPVTTITPDPDGPTIEDSARMAMFIQECREHLSADTEQAALARDYVSERWGLDDDLCARLGVGLAPAGMWWANDELLFSPVFTAVDRIVIPFRDFSGRTVGVQGRALGESRARWAGAINPEGRAWSRYAAMILGTGLDVLVACEGPGDSLAVCSAGFDSFAIRGAAVVKNERLISEIVSACNGRRVVIAGDQDDAGARFTEILADALTDRGVDTYVMTLPAGINDVTEWREHDPDGFVDEFTQAVEQASAWESFAVAPAPDDMPNTEVGVAEYLRECLRLPSGDDGAMYAGGQGWHLWDPVKGWTSDLHGSRIRRTAQQMALDLEAQGRDDYEAALGDADLERAARSRIVAGQRAQRSAFLTGMLKELQVILEVPAENLDRHIHLLATESGVINLRDGTLTEPDPKLLLTKSLAIQYDPSAHCERWTQFIQECHPDNPEMWEYLQRLSGYSLLANPHSLLFFHVGIGANGKTTWAEVVAQVLKGVSTTVPFGTFEARSSSTIPADLAMLAGQRFVLASEGESNKPLSEAMAKRISGHDTIVARHLYGRFFEIRPTFTVHLLSNHRASWSGDSQSEGLWRRIRTVEWPKHFSASERDPYLMSKLLDESQGILNWIIEGAVKFHESGLQDPASVMASTKDYRESSDVLGTFLEGSLVAERGAQISAPALYALYRDHAIDVQGLRESDVLSPRKVYANLRDRGFGTTRARIGGQVTMVFKGLRAKSTDEVDADLESDDGNSPPIGVPAKVTSS